MDNPSPHKTGKRMQVVMYSMEYNLHNAGWRRQSRNKFGRGTAAELIPSLMRVF